MTTHTKKYIITSEHHPIHTNLKRIVAVRDNLEMGVAEGDFGGYVEDEFNLCQTDNSWIGGDACVSGRARVFGDKVCVTGVVHVTGNGYVNDRPVRLIKSPKKGYEVDDGPLTLEQIERIRELSTATNILNENFTQRLFDICVTKQ